MPFIRGTASSPRTRRSRRPLSMPALSSSARRPPCSERSARRPRRAGSRAKPACRSPRARSRSPTSPTRAWQLVGSATRCSSSRRGAGGGTGESGGAGRVGSSAGGWGAFFSPGATPRLQVEHPVTELVTGLDLVALQLRIADGEALPFAQADVAPRGAAIECRITAEDGRAGFVPTGGVVALVREPAGPGVRVDSALVAGMSVPTEYDPLLAKVIAHGPDRATAIARLRRALREMRVAGLPTALPFHRHVLAEPDFVAGPDDPRHRAAHPPPPAPPQRPRQAAPPPALVAVLARRERSARAPQVPDDGAWARAAREDALRELPT